MTLESPSRLPAEQRATCEFVDPISFPGWDGLVSSHSAGNFFHTVSWARVLTETYHFVPQYVVARESGELRGLLPLMECSSWLTGRRGVSLPFTDECEVIASERSNADELFQAALDQGRKRGWRHFELRSTPPASSVSTLLSFVGHNLPLRNNPDQIFEGFDNSVRRAIRKAERSNLEVALSTDMQAVEVYYRLHCQTRRKHGVPPQPFEFFRAIATHVLSAGHGFVALARHKGKAIAGAVFFHFNKHAVYKFSASDTRFQECRGPNLVVWAAIKELSKLGCTDLNFGRTSSTNEGLRRFKRGFGAEEYRIRYGKYSFKEESFISQKDQAEAPARRLFQLLPLTVSRVCGQMLYRHMA